MTKKDKDKDEGKTISIIKELGKLTDLAVYQAQIGAKTKYGRKPHPSDPWGYTKAFLTKFGAGDQFEGVLRLFGEVGATDEVKAALWVATNIRHVK